MELHGFMLGNNLRIELGIFIYEETSDLKMFLLIMHVTEIIRLQGWQYFLKQSPCFNNSQ